jgi:hypothetical protein
MSRQAVLLYITFSDLNLGTLEEVDRIREGERTMRELIEGRNLGELDGHEYGGGQYVIYFYGGDANAIFSELFPFLTSWDCIQGGYAIKRYGPPGAKTEKITFEKLEVS